MWFQSSCREVFWHVDCESEESDDMATTDSYYTYMTYGKFELYAQYISIWDEKMLK